MPKGGKRQGAGRKPAPPTQVLSIRLPDALAAWAKANPKLVRQLIQDAYTSQPEAMTEPSKARTGI